MTTNLGLGTPFFQWVLQSGPADKRVVETWSITPTGVLTVASLVAIVSMTAHFRQPHETIGKALKDAIHWAVSLVGFLLSQIGGALTPDLDLPSGGDAGRWIWDFITSPFYKDPE